MKMEFIIKMIKQEDANYKKQTFHPSLKLHASINDLLIVIGGEKQHWFGERDRTGIEWRNLIMKFLKVIVSCNSLILS